jgi:hypothetical protein
MLPPLHPNCRCTTVLSVDAEAAAEAIVTGEDTMTMAGAEVAEASLA